MRAQKIAQRFGISNLQAYAPAPTPSPPPGHVSGAPAKQPFLYADAPPTARQMAIMEGGSGASVSGGYFDGDDEDEDFIASAKRAPR